MTDTLDNLAIEQLAIENPTAYINSNPSPREWTMTPQDVARSLKLTVEDVKSLTQNKKDSWLGSLGKGVGEGIMGGLETISRTGAVEGLKHTYTSPNMTREEASRLLQDAEYTSHFLRGKKEADSAKTLKHQFSYELGNAIGSMIELVGVGFTTGAPGVMAVAGSQARSSVEETLVDTFVEKTGGIEGSTEEQKSKETLLANAYGVFTGITEMLLGVEKLAAGAINGATKANALSRLARMQGNLTKSALIKYGTQLGKSAVGEGAEEFIQSLGEDAVIALAGYADTLTTDEVLKKAFTSAMYGALIGGPVGMGLYRYNRKTIIDRIKKWSEENELGLEEGQVVNIADSMLDDSRSTIVDEIATRAEIKNQYGKAYETLKARIGEQIDATGTTPWTDQNKSREEYIDAVAMTVALPAVVQANRAGLPLSEFLDTANIQVINNVLYFEPVTDINQLQTMLEQQNDIIAEQNRLAKLNNDDPAAKQNAQRRKAILENAIRGMQLKNGIQTAARTRRKAQADYITAQQLAPEQMGTIDTAVEAQEGQEYVLFGGKKIPVEYQVVELADLQPSHINGTVNPNYSNKELQNRASRGTVQDVADLREKGANITPERLLRGMTSAEGAPITNAQNEVIAGNGRTEIIRVAYENPETAAKYRSALEKAGFSTEGMNQPVLIRKNTTMTTAEQVAAADISNISETSAFDEASQAKRDTQFLKDSADALEFAAKLPMSERRGLMLNNGKWNMRKVQQRYEDALLSWICGNDTQLFEELVLNRGLTQKVIDVLTSNGATIYNLQETYPDTEIRQDIYNALVKMQRATRDNFLDMTQTVELDGHDPMIENTLVWGFLYTNRSGNNLILKNYATTLQENHQAVNNGADMFGNTVAPLSKKDAMIQALQAADEASAQMAADRGRKYEGLFTETGEIKNPELAAAVASYQNQFAAQDGTTLFQLSPELAEQAELAEEMARLDEANPEYTGETINIDGKERTVYNSNGERIAKSEPALRNFWNWFGDSKVVDDKGRPLVMTHFSSEKFDTFRREFAGVNNEESAVGFWFADREDFAFNDPSKRPEKYNVYLRLQNPKIFDGKGTITEQYSKVAVEELDPYTQFQRMIDELMYQDPSMWYETIYESMWGGMERVKTKAHFSNLSAERKQEVMGKIVSTLQEQGYDGVVIKNTQMDSLNENERINQYVAFEPNQIKSTQNRGTFSKDTGNIYYQKGRGKPMGWYDPELQAIVLGKTWNETTIVHEFHHRYLEKIWGIYKQAQAGQKVVNQAWIEETEKLFEMLGIDPSQNEISVEQQEQFASMVEAYITGLGVEKPETQAFTDFLNWVPEKYKSILNIGYLDKDGNIKNPILDEQSVAFFNRWFGNPALPSLPTAPGAQRMVNPTDANGEIVPSTQKEMNNREKEWGQDSEEQNKADAQLWRAIGENTPTDMRAAVDAEEAVMKEEAKALPDDRVLPEEKKQTLRDRWFKTYQPDARERAAEMARKYVKENPEHARELAFADPEIETEYDAPVDRGMLIRAVMETTAKGSDEWYILDNNLAVVKSMSASTLSLSGDISHRAYLDAKREVENARELKAAVNYAGTTRGAMDKWNSDIRDFISKRVGKIIATESNSEERKLAIKAFIEEAKTKFSGNTTNAILNQLDLTGYTTKSQQAFIKWAEKQIKQAAHAHIDVKEQAELMKASIKAQLAMAEIDSAQQDVNGNFARATAAAKDLRHWQFVKDKMKKAYIGKWGRFGIFVDNLFGSYAPSAMLMSINTLFVANIPSTAINNSIVKSSAQKIYGKNVVDKTVIENEKKRIRQIFKASGMNLAQMEKPTSPSVLHGEKYTQQEQSHWYDFVFKTLGWGDNLFRIPTFVDTLARIASKNANGDSAKATKLFREYAQINNASDEAKIARKQALAVANMGVFTQEGILASNLNHIRSSINKLSRGLVGLGPDGYGLGNLLAPFLKTGANVVEMGIRGSIAPVRQITTWAKQMQGKEITDLDKIALRVDWKYFTYTAVAMALLAAISNDDDDWYMEPYQTGHRYDPNKPYDSIKIGNVWVKLDIFGPFAIPMRVAAKIIQRWEDGALTAIANGYGFGASEALKDLPLANQITDNSLSYMAKQPGKWATRFLYNQANKLVPAQLKSIARAGSRATDTELDVSDLGKTIERKFHRNYGFDGEELTTNDIINLFSNRIKVTND